MSVFYPYDVRCGCGHSFTAHLAQSVNGARAPARRAEVLAGSLHRFTCAKCKHEVTVEKPFFYSDLPRNQFFKVLPRNERHRWKEASASLGRAVRSVPDFAVGRGKRALRVVFGLDELREKLVAQDAGLDDRTVELLKLMLAHEHPVLLRRPRLRLTLDHVTEAELRFAAAYEHDPRRFRLSMPRWAAAEVEKPRGGLRSWFDTALGRSGASGDENEDYWFNLWRFSPQPTALDQLRALAQKISDGVAVDLAAPSVMTMLNGLPRGSHLPNWAKQDLRTLFLAAKKAGLKPLEDKLFEIRFGVELEDDWGATASDANLQTLWDLLKDLPDSNVEGSTTIREILLDVGKGGGIYDPSSHDIAIGSHELGNQERFEDVVRHEVAHAVHEMRDELVTGWLRTRFGWQIFDADDAGIDAWVGLMDGWGDLTATQKADVRKYLRTALGDGSSWKPGKAPVAPAGHPWRSATFGPRLAYERTPEDWYANYKTWYRKGSKAFFLNYWYRQLMVVDIATLELIAKMPDNYAAMSHAEFFAELYALYYDLDDPKRSVIPKEVMDWFKANIGAPEPGAPRPAKLVGTRMVRVKKSRRTSVAAE